MKQAKVKGVDLVRAKIASSVAVSAWLTNKSTPKDDTLDALIAFLGEKGVYTTAAYIRYGDPVPVVAAPAVPSTSSSYSSRDVEHFAMLYNTKKAQGAPKAELDALLTILTAAVRAGVTLKASTPDEKAAIDEFTSGFVRRLTRRSERRSKSDVEEKQANGSHGKGRP